MPVLSARVVSVEGRSAPAGAASDEEDRIRQIDPTPNLSNLHGMMPVGAKDIFTDRAVSSIVKDNARHRTGVGSCWAEGEPT